MLSRAIPKLSWQIATVESILIETTDVKTFTLAPEKPIHFVAGQHIDVRLTAPDGYQAQRSYSIASAPERNRSIDITIELLDDGEVSPYFHHVVQPGDKVEFRGPIGGPFTWDGKAGDRLLLVGGGSGIVPLMSMLRHRVSSGLRNSVPALLLYSSRTANHIIYRQALELMQASDHLLKVEHTLTRNQPTGWSGGKRRVDSQMLSDAHQDLQHLSTKSRLDTRAYICGPSDFVESVALCAVDLGIPVENIRTERFGPTGT